MFYVGQRCFVFLKEPGFETLIVFMKILYCRRFKWYFVHTKVMWRERERSYL